MSNLTRRGLAAGPAHLRPLANVLDPLLHALAWARAIRSIRRQRQQLMALDERMLADIGISRADAWREGTRPFHDLPRSGRRHG